MENNYSKEQISKVRVSISFIKTAIDEIQSAIHEESYVGSDSYELYQMICKLENKYLPEKAQDND